MKKILILLLTIFLISGCSKKKENSMTVLTLAKLNEKLENEDSFVVILVRESCNVCSVAYPIFEEVVNDLEESAFYVYFTIDWLNNNGTDSEPFLKLLSYIGKDVPDLLEGFDVPLALYVSEGEIIYHVMGMNFLDKDNITENEHKYQYNCYAKGFTLLD